jgi:hypothetical protein
MMRTLLAAAAALALTGCASSGAAWISASKFNYRDYWNEKVALMPVRLHESIDADKFPAKALNDAIAEQLDILAISDVEDVSDRDAAGLSFPYTPKSMVEFAKKHNSETQHEYRAVVGATMLRIDAAPWSKEWSITGNITFVDVKKPERRWTIAKTWQLSGEPGSRSARVQLESLLTGDFFDVRHAVRRGRFSVLMRRETVIVDVGPILNLDVVKLESGSLRQAGQRLVVDASATPGAPPEIAFDLFAIDDSGIASLVIENTNACFRDVIFGPEQEPICPAQQVVTGTAEQTVKGSTEQVAKGSGEQSAKGALEPSAKGNPVRLTKGDPEPAAKRSPAQQQYPTEEQKRDLPIYLANRAFVPLRPGENVVRAISSNGDLRPVTRTITIVSQAPQNKGVEAMIIFANSYEQLPANSVRPDVAARVAELAAQNGELIDGNRTITLAGEHASREEILGAVATEWAAPSAAGRRVVAFVGRAEEIVGRVYLYLYDARAKYPEIDSLSVDELHGIIGLGVTDATVEVCTRDTSPERMRALLTRALTSESGPRVGIHVTQCSEPFGGRFLQLNNDLALK